MTATAFVGDGSGLTGIGAANANVSSNGTTGYVSYFGNATTLSNSIIYQSGNDIGVGTLNPSAKFEVAGSTKMTSSDTSLKVTEGGDVIITLG